MYKIRACSRTLIRSACSSSAQPTCSCYTPLLRPVRLLFSRYSGLRQVDHVKQDQYPNRTEKENKMFDSIYGVFKSVAPKYDLMNDVLSLGVHRYWKDEFVRVLNPTAGVKVIDVAGGTGDIAFRILQYVKYASKQKSGIHDYHHLSPITNYDDGPLDDSDDSQTSVVLSDINQHMLNVAIDRARQLGISESQDSRLSFLCADAEDLPVQSNSFDAYTIAFGLRNVVNREKALREAHRVLKPGGRFLCLEFSHIKNLPLKWLYDNYSFQVIPVAGQIIANDWSAYQYLVESIRKFPNQETLCHMIEAAGFSTVRYDNFFSGMTAIHSGFKL